MKQLLPLFALLFCLNLAGTVQAADGLAYGQPFPELALSLSADQDARGYLGVDDETSFTLSGVKAEIVLVEFLNVHCPHCQMQAPSYNELLKEIAKAGKTPRIKLLGIAVGNLPEEVAAFRSTRQVQFPIVADSDFRIWRSIDGHATPYTVYVRQTESGKPGLVAGSHLGLNTHYQQLLDELDKLADVPPATIAVEAERTDKQQQAIVPLFSPTELEYRVRNAFLKTGGGIRQFDAVPLRSGRKVFVARMQAGDQQRTLFAEVVSRPSVCDICHDVHFIYVFDLQGRVLGFDSLQLTKYGNVNWNATEIATMRGRLLGKSLLQPHRYNPQVDAISSATITSALIFDSLNQGKELLQELKEKGF